MGEGPVVLPESATPLSATLSPATSALSDLTLEEIEDSISKLQIAPPESSPAGASRDDIVAGNGNYSNGPPAPADPRTSESHAEEPASASAANGSRDAAGGPTADSGHTLALLPQAVPQSLEVMSGTPSRSPSPGIKRAGTPSWKISKQAPAEADVHVADSGDSFTQQLMAGAMKLKSSLFKPERISFADVARNPALAKRARAEMDNHQFKGMIEGQDGAVEGRPHDLEVARLQVALDVVEADAEEESKINSQLAHLVCLRLDSSRKAVERLLGILQAVTSAEAAYTRAMNAVSRVRLVSECDGPTLRAALTRFSDIPWMVGEAHAATQGGMTDVTRRCQEVVSALRKECHAISSDSSKAHAAVLQARKAVHTMFLAHRAACRAADDAFLETSRSGKPMPKLETDPWLTESKVVQAHQALHAAQTHQRSMLANAYTRVREHEVHRCEVLKEIAHAFLHAYRNSIEIGAQASDEAGIRAAVDAVDCDHDLAQFTESAAAAVDTGNELAERQAAALGSAVQDLFCSPDIVRQGEMSRWQTGAGVWCKCHFVLTRGGFLHWLKGPQETTPQGSLALARCQFEAGEAPKFNLHEQHGGFFTKGRRLCFQASSVDDSCEWAIALREAIAAHRPR